MDEPPDQDIMESLFFLIIKTIILNPERNFSAAFQIFSDRWAQSSFMLPKKIAERRSECFARFSNQLIDLHFYEAVEYASIFLQKLQLDADGSFILMTFLQKCLTPKVFYIFLMISDKLLHIISSVMFHSIEKPQDIAFQNIFSNILYCLSFSPNEELKELILKLYPTIEILSPLNSLIYFNIPPYHPIISYSAFLVSQIDLEPFSFWWRSTTLLHINF
jgi:hypothetical protein